MEFWGIELKSGGKPVSFRVKNDRKLVVTRATLGEGLGKEKSVIQYLIGGDKNSSVDLCALYPNEKESCSLSLVFERDVDFTVIGDRGILLTGYLQTDKGQTCVQDKGKDVNRGVVVEEKKEDGKSYKRFLKNSIFRSKNLSDRRLARKFRDPPPGSCLTGGVYEDLLPTPEERYRLWSTLSTKELQETMTRYMRRQLRKL